MLEFGVLLLILTLLMLGYVALFGYVALKIHELVSLTRRKRADRKFFKKIERFRRDFS